MAAQDSCFPELVSSMFCSIANVVAYYGVKLIAIVKCFMPLAYDHHLAEKREMKRLKSENL